MLLKQLTIGYNSSAPIVNSIDAELRLGDFVCLIGRNGSGKSTLLKTLSGLIKPLSGNLLFTEQESEVLKKMLPTHTLASKYTALVLTHTPDLHNTSVFEMVALGRLPHTGMFGKLQKQDIDISNQAIDRLHISHLAHRNFSTLSDGEKQKTMIACALAQATPYLLLDEPSAFLDHPSKVELMKTLQQLAHEERKGILLSTHDLELAQQFTDTLWEIDQNGELRINKIK